MLGEGAIIEEEVTMCVVVVGARGAVGATSKDVVTIGSPSW